MHWLPHPFNVSAKPNRRGTPDVSVITTLIEGAPGAHSGLEGREIVTSETDKVLSGLHALVAEDNSLMAMLISDMLEEIGISVVRTANSAEGAKEAMSEGGFDIATLDVNLEGHGIYGVASMLHARSIPFVFVTGYRELPFCPAELSNAPRLDKPFTLRQLAAALVKAINFANLHGPAGRGNSTNPIIEA